MSQICAHFDLRCQKAGQKKKGVSMDDFCFPKNHVKRNYPRCSMTGIFAYIYQEVKANVGKYSRSGAHDEQTAFICGRKKQLRAGNIFSPKTELVWERGRGRL